MADRKSVMVEHLRQFARTQWGRGVDRFKARGGLLGTLATRVEEFATRLGLAHSPDVSPPAAAAPAEPGTRSQAPRAPQRPPPGDDEKKTPVQMPTPPARVVSFPPRPRAPMQPRPAERTPPAVSGPVVVPAPPPPPAAPVPAVVAEPPAPVHAEPAAPPTASAPARTESAAKPLSAGQPPPSGEPVVEGFFVARVAGEQEVRRHHLTDTSAAPFQVPRALGLLGSLPTDYADDTVLLLARDPHTLYVLWDFKPTSLQRAAQGLDAPRPVLKLHDGQDLLLGTIDVSLDSRGFYIGGLSAGRSYRVELHFLGRDGRSRRIGRASHPLFLPAAGPSANTEVRFLRMPSPAARRVLPRAEAAQVTLRSEPDQERDYISWRRVVLPGSAEAFVPRAPANGVPPPPGLPGAPAREYLHVPRAGESSESFPGRFGGASEALPPPAGPGPGGPSERSAMGSAGPSGSSEQGPGAVRPGEGSIPWMGSHGPTGSSEQTPGAVRPGQGAVQWMWVYGPVGAFRPGMTSAGPPGSSGSWVGSVGPAGSSEQGFVSQGPAGASEQSVGVPLRSSGPGW